MVKVNYKGQEIEGKLVDIVSQEELWNNYQLADGTHLRIKNIVHDIVLIPGEITAEGDPVYIIKSSQTYTIRRV